MKNDSPSRQPDSLNVDEEKVNQSTERVDYHNHLQNTMNFGEKISSNIREVAQMSHQFPNAED